MTKEQALSKGYENTYTSRYFKDDAKVLLENLKAEGKKVTLVKHTSESMLRDGRYKNRMCKETTWFIYEKKQ